MQRLALLLLLLPATAHADAIMPLAGPCPPGADVGIVAHAETCVPRPCEDDAVCGDGARCGTICLCQAEREVRSNGRVVYAEPRMVTGVVGLCDAQGACAEGEPVQRRQCEPTPAEPPAEEPPSEEPSEAEAEGPAEEPPASAGCAGCAVPRGESTVPAAALVLLILGVIRRR